MTRPVDTSLSRRSVILGTLMTATAGSAIFLGPRPSGVALGEKTFESYFPDVIGPWRYSSASGLVLPPKDQLSESLYDHLLTKVYRGPAGGQIMLLVAYSGAQEGHVMVHRPEICYPAGGYRLVQNEPHTASIAEGVSIPTRFIEAQNSVRREFMIYWTRIGPDMPVSWLDQRIVMARENFNGRLPDGILVRISTIAADSITALATIDAFTRDLFASATQSARYLMIGAR